MRFILFILVLNVNLLLADSFNFTINDGEIRKPKIGLALSGGGARGLSQIGVLKFLEEKDICISYIAGTSIGSIVGGLYASGYSSKELEDILISNNWNETVAISKNKRSELFIDQKEIYDKSLITIKFKNFELLPPEAISTGNPFDEFIQEIFWKASYQPEQNFDSLRIPFRAVATDLVSGKSISFSSGNISKIVRASATIPLRYTPVRLDSMILVDGGILSNIPVEQLEEFSPDLIFAVNSTSPLYDKVELNNAWNMADQVVSIAMQQFSDKSISKADLLIEPNLNGHRNSDFSGVDSLIKIGYETAKLNYPKIQEIIDNNFFSSVQKLSYFDNINKINYPFRIKLIDFPAQLLRKLEIKNDTIHNKAELLNLIKQIHYCLIKYKRLHVSYDENRLQLQFEAKKPIDIIEISSDVNSFNQENLKRHLINKFENIYKDDYLLREIKNEVYSFLRQNGINLVKVNLSIQDDSNKLLINIGDNKINNIRIDGSIVRDFIIKRDLLIKEGENLTVENLQKSWDYVVNTELFSDVEFFPYRDSSSALNIEINLKDGGTQTIRLGGRVDSERNAQGSLILVQENLFNFGGRVSANLNFSESFFNSRLKFENNRIFSTDLNFASEIYYNIWDGFEYIPISNEKINRYSTSRSLNNEVLNYGILLTGGLQLGRDGNLFSSIRYEKQMHNKKSDTIKSDFYTLSSIKFGVVWDNLNDMYFPTSGRVIELSLETNLLQHPDILGFSKAYLFYNTYYSLGGGTISHSLMFGAGDATLPYPEFFFAGGMESFFGYGLEELQGRQIFKGSINYRIESPIDIFFDTYLFTRYDIGNVWANQENIKLNNLKHGLGLGLALDTPVGPAKFAWGKSIFFKNNLKDVVFGQTMLYFSIGLNLN